MNSIDFEKLGGWPLETETLDEMQKAYKLLQAFGDMIGDKSIIRGCVKTGSNVSNGFIYWNGELLEFKGGLEETKIIVIEEKTAVPFEDGDIEEVYTTRYAQFGSGIGEVLWSEFKRPLDTINLTERLIAAETKLATIEEGAEVNVQPDFNITDSSLDAFIKNKPSFNAFLMKGNFNIGDVTPVDVEHTVNFSSVGTSNYLVIGSIISKSANFDYDNDIIWTIKTKTANSFKLLLRDLGGVVQNVEFNYALIPY